MLAVVNKHTWQNIQIVLLKLNAELSWLVNKDMGHNSQNQLLKYRNKVMCEKIWPFSIAHKHRYILHN